MSKSRNPLSQARWAYLKALKPAAPRMVHQSCEAYMIAPTGYGMPWTPYVQKPGVTYNVGRNARKRKERATNAKLRWYMLLSRATQRRQGAA